MVCNRTLLVDNKPEDTFSRTRSSAGEAAVEELMKQLNGSKRKHGNGRTATIDEIISCRQTQIDADQNSSSLIGVLLRLSRG